jgi:hypothetical protein
VLPAPCRPSAAGCPADRSSCRPGVLPRSRPGAAVTSHRPREPHSPRQPASPAGVLYEGEMIRWNVTKRGTIVKSKVIITVTEYDVPILSRQSRMAGYGLRPNLPYDFPQCPLSGRNPVQGMAALRIASVSVNQTASSFLRRDRTRRKAAAPSGVPITKGWIPMTTVVASRAGSARASLASSNT